MKIKNKIMQKYEQVSSLMKDVEKIAKNDFANQLVIDAEINLAQAKEKARQLCPDDLPPQPKQKQVKKAGKKIKDYIHPDHQNKHETNIPDFLSQLRILVNMAIDRRKKESDHFEGSAARDIQAIIEALTTAEVFSTEPGYAAISDLCGELPFKKNLYSNVKNGKKYDDEIKTSQTYYKHDIDRLQSILYR